MSTSKPLEGTMGSTLFSISPAVDYEVKAPVMSINRNVAATARKL